MLVFAVVVGMIAQSMPPNFYKEIGIRADAPKSEIKVACRKYGLNILSVC